MGFERIRRAQRMKLIHAGLDEKAHRSKQDRLAAKVLAANLSTSRRVVASSDLSWNTDFFLIH